VPVLSEANEAPPYVIPKLVTDPVASLTPWPIEIQVGSVHAIIPATYAVDWLSILMVGDKLWLEDVFPGMTLDPDAMEEALEAGQLDAVDFQDLALAAISSASGRPWWVALRLIETVRANWDQLGPEFVYRNIDATRVSLSAWLDVTMLLALKSVKQDQIPMFLAQLEAPPPGEEAADDGGMNADQFLSMM
jgi:hypothetical protein